MSAIGPDHSRDSHARDSSDRSRINHSPGRGRQGSPLAQINSPVFVTDPSTALRVILSGNSKAIDSAAAKNLTRLFNLRDDYGSLSLTARQLSQAMRYILELRAHGVMSALADSVAPALLHEAVMMRNVQRSLRPREHLVFAQIERSLSKRGEDTLLIHAYRHRNNEAVRKLLGVPETLNLPGRNGITLLMLAAERGDTKLVSQLAGRNADLTATDQYGETYLHKALRAGTFQAVVTVRCPDDLAIHSSALLTAASANGTTPLHLAMELNQLAAANQLINAHLRIDAPIAQPLKLFKQCEDSFPLLSDDPKDVLRWIQVSSAVWTSMKASGVKFELTNDKLAIFLNALNVAKLSTGVPPPKTSSPDTEDLKLMEIATLLAKTRSLHSATLLAQSFAVVDSCGSPPVYVASNPIRRITDAVSRLWKPPALQYERDQPLPLTELLPTLIFNGSPGQVRTLVGEIEAHIDLRNDERDWHPFEAELMALLQHPKAQPPRPVNLNYLTNAITAIPGFTRVGVQQINAATVILWGAIGHFGLSFLNWKHATRTPLGIDSSISLFEQFGFQTHYTNRRKYFRYIPKVQWREAPGQLGIVRNISLGPDDLFELSRLGAVVYNRNFGALFVRNSSPDGGRHALLHPAYYHFAGGIGELDLHGLSEKKIAERWRSILDPSLYRDTSTVLDMHTLFEKLLLVLRAFSRWQFDTDRELAWTDSFVPAELTGGYLSPGFTPTLDYLGGLLTATEGGGLAGPPPALAFVHPGYIPVPYRFTDLSGVTRDRLVVTRPVLEELGKLVKGGASDTRLNELGIRPFIQDAGLTNQARLVIL